MRRESLKTKPLYFALCFISAQNIFAQVNNPVADSAITAFNKTFLITDNRGTSYLRLLGNDYIFDSGWTLALNMQGMFDAYERTGSAEHKDIVDKLTTTFLNLNHPPFDWDGWNDDLAWVGLCFARGYELNGDTLLLNAAESTFNEAFDRGWSTEFTNGGIWEEQPNYSNESSSKIKEALSNNPMGHLACLLYQSTGNQYYLDKAKQIYEWSVSHIFDPMNGHVYGGIYRNDNLNTSATAYNQGAFIDFSTSLYNITGDEQVLRNAVLAVDYTISELTTADSIVSTSSLNHNTWAAEFARGLGHLAKSNPELWNKYYAFLKKNSVVTWSNRRKELNLTWNGWAIPTAEETGEERDIMANIYISSVALHQHTPVVQSVIGTVEAEYYNFRKGITTESIDAGGKSVKLANAGDWVEYIVEVPENGTYTFSFDVAATEAASFEVQQNHDPMTTINVAATGGFDAYDTVRAAVKLKAGFQSVRFKSVSGELNINWWSTEKCDLIQPIIYVDGVVATDSVEATLNAGVDLLFSPLPADGTWSWTGPDGFTADSREVSVTDFSEDNGGVYIAQYINEAGCISSQDFRVSIADCSPTPLTAKVFIYNKGWQEHSDIIEAGSFVKIAGAPTQGNWSWTGPDGFTANTPEISFNNIGYKEAGEYTATYYNTNGCKTTAQVTLNLIGEDPCGTPIVPYINIGGWSEATFGSVKVGASFQFGPQPLSGGTWSWTGPGGFTSNQREFTVTDFNQSKAGKYIASFTNAKGCISTREFIIGLEGCAAPSIVPEILVDGQAWPHTDSVSVNSGGSYSITAPEIAGQWIWTGGNNGGERWEGLYGFTSNERTVSFENVLDVREGTLTLTHVSEDACVSEYTIDVFVTGDDFCGTEIVPYINKNNAGWEESSSASLDVGQRFIVGPQLVDKRRGHWEWVGPAGFTADTREFTITNIQPGQAGTYQLTVTNYIGCKSSIDYTISVAYVNGIDEIERNSVPSVYPNPASDRIMFDNISPNSIIRILDIKGTKVKTEKANNMGTEVEIDISGLLPGIYLIIIEGDETKVLKLIKE